MSSSSYVFGKALLDASVTKWAGSRPFAIDIVEEVLCSKYRHAVEALWRMGGLDLDQLVNDIGDRYCDMDAARARGVGPFPDRRTVLREYFEEMWGVGAL